MSVDRLSLSTVPVVPIGNNLELATATAFVWKHHDSFYLITNWHVVSGLDFNTLAHLAEGACRPDTLRCSFILRPGEFDRETIDVAIRDKNDEPIWLVHPFQKVDIVAIPIDHLKDRVFLSPINEVASGKLAIWIGMDVFILGYPFGPKPPAFPVWKRGSIASEPDLVLIYDGYYLVDTASRPGMSGSPVILRSWSNHILESNTWIAKNDRLPIDRIIGIYSGRLRPVDAQVGLVWHESYIDEILIGHKIDT